MEMIPATPYGTHSQAEKRVFDLLRKAFPGDPTLTAYHSLTLTRHFYKRFGEIDFLICGEAGIFVLEVKGGRIQCSEGVWSYTNRYGDISKSLEGPFRQAETALHGLISRLRESLSDGAVSQFTIGYGVIVPDCEWHVQGVEWDSKIVADARACRNIESWLGNLFNYWHAKEGRPRRPDQDALKAIKQFLRPEFETAVPLYIQAGRAEENAARLTEDQMAMVDVVHANPRVLCSGGAGTGKTFLALELARRWTSQGQKVLLSCRSSWLKHYLESKFVLPDLTVSLVESISTARKRSGVDRFDALIVDEGQDLMDMESLHRLDAAIKGGLGQGHWCFFCDANNQSGFFGPVDRDAADFLDGCNPARVPLITNCRNTRTILNKVQSMLGADMGVRGVGEGPEVRENGARSRKESAALLAKEIYDIVEDGGIAAGAVTILSPLPFEESSASLLPDAMRQRLTLLDEYSLRSFPTAEMGFARIPNFKGLENEAVIVVDLVYPGKDTGPLSLHYVAMSRARAVLSVIFRE